MITIARFFETRILILIKEILFIFFLLSLIAFFHCEKFFLFIEILFIIFSQLSSDFFSFDYCDDKIVERRKCFEHEYILLKFNIKSVSNNLQLIINKKFN